MQTSQSGRSLKIDPATQSAKLPAFGQFGRQGDSVPYDIKYAFVIKKANFYDNVGKLGKLL